MKHLGTRNLSTRRLVLRRLRMSDAEVMFENWAQDREVTKYLTWKPHDNIETTRKLMRKWVNDYKDPEVYMWAITLRSDLDRPIGTISVVDLSRVAPCCEVGYALGRPWWNQGYATEALQEVIRFLIRDVGFARVGARHDPRNAASGRVMEKCGMTREGILRKACVTNSGLSDMVCWSILESELKP